MGTLTRHPDFKQAGGVPAQFLPPESPMAMSKQPLQDFESRADVQSAALESVALRRACIFTGTAAMTGAGSYEMYEVLQVGGVTMLEWTVLFLFVPLFAWIAFSFMSALAGFAVLLLRTRDPLGIDPDAPVPSIDSLMTGDTIVRLVSAMESHPGVALIQTLPIIVNAKTLFARLQQFSGRLYGPLVAAGVAWWHGSEGNYWGHNAIIRVRAFAQDAGLPELSGRKPFGGHILSHDFIEAALMRRGGWAIHMAPSLGGSYEECPPSSLLDFAA